MELTATLTLEQWSFILEALQLSDKPTISGMAIGLLKPQLDQQFNELNMPGFETRKRPE